MYQTIVYLVTLVYNEIERVIRSTFLGTFVERNVQRIRTGEPS